VAALALKVFIISLPLSIKKLLDCID
jgi:hypothetical protein